MSGSEGQEAFQHSKKLVEIYEMDSKRTYDIAGHAHFITFSCYKRRRLLYTDTAKRIVISILASEIKKHNAQCSGFVIMPEHVHAIVRFSETGQLNEFMKQWKGKSSLRIKRYLLDILARYNSFLQPEEPVWQRKYYDLNIYSYKKLYEKLTYMHENPIAVGLVNKAEEWPYSSAVWYTSRRSVGVPLQLP